MAYQAHEAERIVWTIKDLRPSAGSVDYTPKERSRRSLRSPKLSSPRGLQICFDKKDSMLSLPSLWRNAGDVQKQQEN